MDNAPSETLQRSFWNRWNTLNRENDIQEVSQRQAQIVTGWLAKLKPDKQRTILEVGCGSGWLCPQLADFGRVTGTDLSDEVLARAQKKFSHVEFKAGDFMHLDLGEANFDVIVTLEVLSHVPDQAAFVRKLARHLKPGGMLMLATQNRPVLERFNRIPAPSPGQLRRWVDRHELHGLLSPSLEVQQIFAVTPKANKGLMRILNSRRLDWPVRAVLGDNLDRAKEKLGFGWTLMALARKPHEPQLSSTRAPEA